MKEGLAYKTVHYVHAAEFLYPEVIKLNSGIYCPGECENGLLKVLDHIC